MNSVWYKDYLLLARNQRLTVSPMLWLARQKTSKKEMKKSER